MEKIDNNIINQILYRFPVNINNINTNYNNKCNNKNLYNKEAKYFVLKPKGIRALLWFTYIKKEVLCILILLKGKNINDLYNEFYKFNINFDNTLCYNNVLLSGIYFNINKKYFYIVDNIHNFNLINNLINKESFNNILTNRLIILNELFNNVKNSSNYNIFLPVILDNINILFKKINNINYNLYSINIFSNTQLLGNYLLNNKISKLYATFKITANIINDIYNLYILDNKNNYIFYDLALINNYKTSIFMNSLFRDIIENTNLDYLEESESEEDFENINIDKYVDLEKFYIIDCFYNEKFKKWIPEKISKNKVINNFNLINLIKNKKKYFYNI
tara:strand:- start:863 stop:1864 length:1002 start_codon:yes stop_codon:yes gene_type:complete